MCTRASVVAFAPAVQVAAVLEPLVGPQVVQWPVLFAGFMPATAAFVLPFCCTWACEFELACELAWLVELVWVELVDVAVVPCFACPGATWSDVDTETD